MSTHTEAKHTPESWRYEAETKTIRSVPANLWIATLDSWDAAVNNEANARLMALAPEFLMALKDARHVVAGEWHARAKGELGEPFLGRLLKEIDSLLARAKGGV